MLLPVAHGRDKESGRGRAHPRGPGARRVFSPSNHHVLSPSIWREPRLFLVPSFSCTFAAYKLAPNGIISLYCEPYRFIANRAAQTAKPCTTFAYLSLQPARLVLRPELTMIDTESMCIQNPAVARQPLSTASGTLFQCLDSTLAPSGTFLPNVGLGPLVSVT